MEVARRLPFLGAMAVMMEARTLPFWEQEANNAANKLSLCEQEGRMKEIRKLQLWLKDSRYE
jgi:hypothetical protein